MIEFEGFRIHSDYILLNVIAQNSGNTGRFADMIFDESGDWHTIIINKELNLFVNNG